MERFFDRVEGLMVNQLEIKTKTRGILQSVEKRVWCKNRNKALTIQGAKLAVPKMAVDILTGKAVLQIIFFKKTIAHQSHEAGEEMGTDSRLFAEKNRSAFEPGFHEAEAFFDFPALI